MILWTLPFFLPFLLLTLPSSYPSFFLPFLLLTLPSSYPHPSFSYLSFFSPFLLLTLLPTLSSSHPSFFSLFFLPFLLLTLPSSHPFYACPPPPTMRSCCTQLHGTGGREGIIMRENVASCDKHLPPHFVLRLRLQKGRRICGTLRYMLHAQPAS